MKNISKIILLCLFGLSFLGFSGCLLELKPVKVGDTLSCRDFSFTEDGSDGTYNYEYTYDFSNIGASIIQFNDEDQINLYWTKKITFSRTKINDAGTHIEPKVAKEVYNETYYLYEDDDGYFINAKVPQLKKSFALDGTETTEIEYTNMRIDLDVGFSSIEFLYPIVYKEWKTDNFYDVIGLVKFKLIKK